MEVSDPMQLASFLAEASDAVTKWIAHPDGEVIASGSNAAVDAATLLIGPEGGWTQDEIEEAITAGYQKISLGKRIYRIETAAVYLASKLIQD